MKHAITWRRSVFSLLAAVSLVGLATLTLNLAGRAQSEITQVPAPAVRVTVRFVLADAVVTDKGGKAVTGLASKDFTVLDDGKPQKGNLLFL